MAEYLSDEDMNTGEYISRDEALKIFHQFCDNCTNNYNGVMCRACADAGAMDILIDMPAADVQLVDMWISVKDHLPEIIGNTSSEDVLIHLKNGEQYVAFLVGEDNENGVEAFWSTSDMHRDFECDVVTHWQPLPKPPQD